MRRGTTRREPFGRDPEVLAERAGERFVRAVFRIQRDMQDVGRAGCQRPRRLGEATGTHITHDRQTGSGRKRPHQVEARDAGNAGDLVERQIAGEMAFDIPQRFLGRVHEMQPLFEAFTS